MLQQKIRDDMQAAMRARDTLKLDTLRMLIAVMTNEMKARGGALVDGVTDDEVLTLIRREVKKRKEAAAAYRAGNRLDLALKENAECLILEEYLPAQMTEDEIREVVKRKKEDLGITDKKDFGTLIGRVMKELQGKADGATVQKVIESLWS